MAASDKSSFYNRKVEGGSIEKGVERESIGNKWVKLMIYAISRKLFITFS